jgi:hypothetical protein
MIINRNTTDIIRLLNTELKTNLYTNDEHTTMLKNHQFLIKTFFYNIHFNDVKGMLLYHKMGTGKTILSISIAMDFDGDVIVFMYTSLINNYINDIKKYLSLIQFKTNFDSFIDSKFTFISLNAYNLYTKIPSDLNKKLIIIDEAHHVFSGVLNGSKNHVALYYALRNAPDIKILLLTGTPIANDPYEIMVCFNILTKHLTFPESYDEFISIYTDIKKVNTVLYEHRLHKLENRIVGLISFFEQTINDDYPDDFGIHIVKCNMIKSQLNKYLNFKKIEDEKASNSFKKNVYKSASISKSNSYSNYRIQTRMICNVDPEFNLLSCVKFNKIYENIISHHGCALVYSQFINNFGLLGFSQYLLLKGYSLFNFNTGIIDSHIINNNNNNNTHKHKRFSIIKGDVSFDKRNFIQQTFNNPNNITGDIIHILLISSTGAEGLDLKFIRSVHIIEPYWNNSRIEQIRSRAIRYKSHSLLPKKHQNVHTFLYLSTFNLEQFTTDEEIYSMSIDKQTYINDFLFLLKRVSVDCFFHFHDCFTCDAVNIPLFRTDFLIDINFANQCNIQVQSDIDVIHVRDDVYHDKKTNSYYKKINDKLIKI